MDRLWTYLEARLPERGERTKTVNCKFSVGLAKMLVEAERNADFEVKRRLVAIHGALDDALGDSDPTDDMTDEEIREEYPVLWAAKQIADIIGDGPWDKYLTEKVRIDLSNYLRRGTSIGVDLDGPEVKKGDEISWNGRIEIVECVFTHRDRSGPRTREVVVRLKENE